MTTASARDARSQHRTPQSSEQIDRLHSLTMRRRIAQVNEVAAVADCTALMRLVGNGVRVKAVQLRRRAPHRRLDCPAVD